MDHLHHLAARAVEPCLRGGVEGALAVARDEAQLRAGTIDLVTLLVTQQALFQARDALTRARLNRLQAAVGLFKALGGGWEGAGITPRPILGGLASPCLEAVGRSPACVV